MIKKIVIDEIDILKLNKDEVLSSDLLNAIKSLLQLKNKTISQNELLIDVQNKLSITKKTN